MFGSLLDNRNKSKQRKLILHKKGISGEASGSIHFLLSSNDMQIPKECCPKAIMVVNDMIKINRELIFS